MTDEQRLAIHNVLMGAEYAQAANEATKREVSDMITADIRLIEPLIDEMIRQAREAEDIECVSIPFHAVVQILVMLRFREWIEYRPGFVRCPECHAEHQATLPAERHHRSRCRVGDLIKFLQATIQTEGSNTMPFPNSREALKEHGYVYSHSKTCEACNVMIEMWTTPKNNLMPLDFKQTEHGETCEPHFATCKNPALYSRRLREKEEKKKAAAASDAPMSPDA